MLKIFIGSNIEESWPLLGPTMLFTWPILRWIIKSWIVSGTIHLRTRKQDKKCCPQSSSSIEQNDNKKEAFGKELKN